jgi:hypothetical protein
LSKDNLANIVLIELQVNKKSNKVILMRTLAALIFAMLVSKPVSAQIWDHLITLKDATEYLIDPASVIKKESIVRYTQLINYPKGYDGASRNILSIQQFKEIDCKDNLIKTISMIAYSEMNARGNILTLSVGRENKMLKINQNSVSGLYKDEVCK